MNSTQKYLAPWSGWLVGISLFASGILVAVPLLVLINGKAPAIVAWGAAIFCPLTLFLCALFTIRSYTIQANAIAVQRLLWNTRIAIGGLQQVAIDPYAVTRSLRLCGNGGLFSFTGWFYNRRLGLHRLFVTDPKRAVVLKFDRRTIVVSPDRPAEFAHQVRMAGGLAEI